MDEVIDYGLTDRRERPVRLRPVGADNWREVADIAPRDDQREFVFALAARYILSSTLGDDWHSLGVYAGDEVVGHVMWGMDEKSFWIGGLVIAAEQQSAGIGRATMLTLIRWFTDRPERDAIGLTYEPHNPAARLYDDLGFVPTGETDGDELVAVLRLSGAAVDHEG
jgi:diamine N-acetyltransferase